jgi:hypothetical protein
VQQLHLVGFTTDSDHLILSAKKGAKSGSFTVPLDERLLEVIADAVRRRNSDDSEVTAAPLPLPPELKPASDASKRVSALSPRELQARLRAGRSVAQVAREAGADEEWVAKFEPPVLAERERIVNRARELVYVKPRRGESAERLGLAVRWNLADRGIRYTDGEFDTGWSAFHVGAATWGVTFAFASRGRRNVAEWEVDFAEGEVLARNRAASDLGYAEPGRRRRLAALVPMASDAPPSAPRARDANAPGADDRAPAKRAAPKKRGAKKTAPVKRIGKKSARKSVPARKTAGRRAAPARATAKKATKKATKKAAKKTSRTTKKARATRTTKATRSTRPSKRARRPRVDPVEVAPPRPTPPAVVSTNELARRRLELVGKQLPAARPARALKYATPPTPARPRPQPAPRKPEPPEPLDVDPSAPPAATGNDAERAARERREERRRARAERVARASAVSLPQPAVREAPSDSSIPTDDERVVTIRASRAAGGTGDVVVPGGPRPLRPAQPAARPRRRRFTRSR